MTAFPPPSAQITTDDRSIAPPPILRGAFVLYLVSAGLGALGLVVTIAFGAALADGTTGISPRALIAFGLGFGVVVQVALIICELVFAPRMIRGSNAARIVLTVLAAIQVFGILSAFFIGFVQFIVLLIALILSWTSTENTWFRSRRQVTAPAV
ncbi:hypothetical protein [uncultured Amnibacterium sp.]|uniref:hypothetical protein n=1 Tax=uncultured Amnibacterium sp. TaxID=1631851 RepID=UPI0035CACB31